jgi:predicted GNAT superfamily acetyltransferase
MADGDLAGVLELNERWVPRVGHLDAGRLAALVEQAELALVMRDGATVGSGPDPGGGPDSGGPDSGGPGSGAPAGFVIVLGPGADYDSPNYRWFEARREAFTYVDRIAVHDGAQGSGVGRVLYEAVAEHAASGRGGVVCAEVNLTPPNPESMAFHTRMGFVPVGSQWTYGDTVEVQMLEWVVRPDGRSATGEEGAGS